MTKKSQARVTVHALRAGYLTLPERFFITPIDHEDARKTVPSLSFLIQHHSPSGQITRLVFDLGIRRNIDLYSAPIRKHAETRQPVGGMPDVVTSLAQGGLTPDDIDVVIFSHVHWDHIGMPSDFKTSTFVVGHGAISLLDGTNVLANGSHSHFEKDLLPKDRTIELSSPDRVLNDEQTGTTTNGPDLHSSSSGRNGTISFSKDWIPIKILPKTMDIFGDGSVLLVSAPGHLPGHINLMCLDEHGKYIYLAGDSFHDARLMTGEKRVATWKSDEFPHTECCIHADKFVAEQTISLIRTISSGQSGFGQVEVIFSHDLEWERASTSSNRFFPGHI